MLTPVDIENIEFAKAPLGYRPSQVDAFLEAAARDFEALTRENVELRQQVEELGKRLADFVRLEDSIRKALVLAENTAEEARANARRESDLLVEQARQEAARTMDAARGEARQIEQESARIRQQRERFVMEFTALLRSHLAALDKETGERGEPA